MRRYRDLTPDCIAALGAAAEPLQALVATRPKDLDMYASMLSLAQALASSNTSGASGPIHCLPVSSVELASCSSGRITCHTGKVAWNNLTVCLALAYTTDGELQKEGAQLLVSDLLQVQLQAGKNVSQVRQPDSLTGGVSCKLQVLMSLAVHLAREGVGRQL